MATVGSTLWVHYYKTRKYQRINRSGSSFMLKWFDSKACSAHIHAHPWSSTLTNPCTLETDLQEFSRSILGRWQSLYSSIRSSNLGLRPGSEVSSLSWHAEAAWPIRPSLRAERGKTKLTVLQCQVSVQIAVHLAGDNKGGKKLHKWKTKTEITVVLDDNLGENNVYATV